MFQEAHIVTEKIVTYIIGQAATEQDRHIQRLSVFFPLREVQSKIFSTALDKVLKLRDGLSRKE